MAPTWGKESVLCPRSFTTVSEELEVEELSSFTISPAPGGREEEEGVKVISRPRGSLGVPTPLLWDRRHPQLDGTPSWMAPPGLCTHKASQIGTKTAPKAEISPNDHLWLQPGHRCPHSRRPHETPAIPCPLSQGLAARVCASFPRAPPQKKT